MSVNNCEKVQMARMAHDSNEQAAMSPDEIAAHIATCEDCRQQTEQLRALDLMFERHTRRQYDADLWPAIQRRISSQTSTSWTPFAVVCLLLGAYKMFEMVADNPPALVFNLVPVLLMFALFVVIRENPFRINSELMMEMDK